MFIEKEVIQFAIHSLSHLKLMRWTIVVQIKGYIFNYVTLNCVRSEIGNVNSNF